MRTLPEVQAAYEACGQRISALKDAILEASPYSAEALKLRVDLLLEQREQAVLSWVGTGGNGLTGKN